MPRPLGDGEDGGSPVGKRVAFTMPPVPVLGWPQEHRAPLPTQVLTSAGHFPLHPLPKSPSKPPALSWWGAPQRGAAASGGLAGLGSPHFVSGGRVRGNACAGRGMSSASWLASLDPVPGNVTGNSEWAGPAPEQGAPGGQAHPRGARARGYPPPGRTAAADPAGGCCRGALTAGRLRRAEAPALLPPAKFAPCIFLPCRSQLHPARRGSPRAPGPAEAGAARGPPASTAQEVRAGSGASKEGVTDGDLLPRARVWGTVYGEQDGAEPHGAAGGHCAGNEVAAIGVPWGGWEFAPHFLCRRASPSRGLSFPTVVITIN